MVEVSMDWTPIDPEGKPLPAFKIAKIRKLQDLENGTYWSELHPYFLRSEFRERLKYSIKGRVGGQLSGVETVSVRAASKAGELDVAFISDQLAATMAIKDPGLPDYCLTLVSQDHLVYRGDVHRKESVDDSTGLIYRGRPGTELAATGLHERLAIWIPQSSLTQRLVALLGQPVQRETEFHPVFNWHSQRAQALRHLVGLLMFELKTPAPSILGSAAASRSLTDLLIYTLLRSLDHTFSPQLERSVNPAAPGTLRRAEAFIRANVEEPIAMHEVAAAAGCSLRSLQLAFRSFRETTPLLAICQSRLEAARAAIAICDPTIVTITEIANRFGFANACRFSQFYRKAFGESPAEALRRRGP
jgi:AraC-like DNA-binding protein